MQLTQTLFLSAALAFCALTSPLQAQIQAAPTVINMDVRANIDPIGNGHVTLTLKMNALQWAGWKSEYGNNPSLFKRDISKLFSDVEVTEFKLEQDDMQRQAVVSIQAKGMSIYQGDGIFEVELEKEMAGGEWVGSEFRVTYTDPQGPSLLTLVDQRIQLPDNAKQVEITKNSKGEDVLRYEMQQPSGPLPWGWFGIAFALLGGGLFFTGRQHPGHVKQ